MLIYVCCLVKEMLLFDLIIDVVLFVVLSCGLKLIGGLICMELMCVEFM